MWITSIAVVLISSKSKCSLIGGAASRTRMPNPIFYNLSDSHHVFNFPYNCPTTFSLVYLFIYFFLIFITKFLKINNEVNWSLINFL